MSGCMGVCNWLKRKLEEKLMKVMSLKTAYGSKINFLMGHYFNAKRLLV